MEELYGYDIDGVLSENIHVKFPYIIISGRTFKEYDNFVKQLAQTVPVYIRGIGEYGDRQHAGEFKSKIINLMGVDEYYEDDPLQADIIKANCKKCKVILIK